MNDRLDIKKYIRTVEDFPIPGIRFRDITSLAESPVGFAKACKELIELAEGFNPVSVVSIESRGFIFASPLAVNLSIPFILARKPGKLPNDSYSKSFDLEYGSTSIEIQKNTFISNNDRVVIVDDLIATGGTAIACCEILVENFGIEKSNILFLGVIDLPDLGGSQRIKDAGHNIEVLVSY